MTLNQLKTLIHSKHNPALAEQIGHVYQVWEDGEITMQKCGPLLWQRTLHCMSSGATNVNHLDIMPEKFKDGSHGWAYVTNEDAELIQDAMLQYSESLLEK